MKKKYYLIYLAIIFLIIDYSAGTLYFKYIYPKSFREYHPYYHHGLIAMADGITENYDWNIYKVYTNSLGFKDFYPKNISTKVNKRRILFIGDSFTEGLGVPVEKSFYGLVSSKLEKDSVDILNAGCASYSPLLYYLKTKYLLEQENLKFDELFVFIDISDIQDEINYEYFKPEMSFGLKDEFSNFMKKHSAVRFVVDQIIKNIFDKVEDKHKLIPLGHFQLTYDEIVYQRDKWSCSDSIYKLYGEYGTNLARENMQKLVDLCKSRNIKVNLAIYPWPYQITNHCLTDRNVNLWTSFCMENKLNLINLYPDFINNEDPKSVIEKYYLHDDPHWNENGHKITANRIIPYILK